MRPRLIKNDAMHTQEVCQSMRCVWVIEWWSWMVVEVVWGVKRSQTRGEKDAILRFCVLSEKKHKMGPKSIKNDAMHTQQVW